MTKLNVKLLPICPKCRRLLNRADTPKIIFLFCMNLKCRYAKIKNKGSDIAGSKNEKAG